MHSGTYLKTGRWLFAIAMLSIGIIHLATQNFPVGLLPVSMYVAGRVVLVYLCGLAMITAGALLFTKKFAHRGGMLASFIFLVILAFLHLPKLFGNLHDAGEWTAAFEVVALFGGALMISGNAAQRANNLFITGLYIFALALLVFALQHYLYLQFIVTLIPAWLPGRTYWAWLVLAAFTAAFVSLVIQKMVQLSATLLAIMFLSWFLILHLPRVIASPKVEPEWTSMFIALAMAGIALTIAGANSTSNRQQ